MLFGELDFQRAVQAYLWALPIVAFAIWQQAHEEVFGAKNGDWLDGGAAYRLRVPPDPPAKQFWSVTLYDIATRRFIDTPEQRADRSSRQDLAKNADGSIDLYFAPKPPPGAPESNWIPTAPSRAWFAYLRLYGPLEAYMNETWPLPDIEPIKPA